MLYLLQQEISVRHISQTLDNIGFQVDERVHIRFTHDHGFTKL